MLGDHLPEPSPRVPQSCLPGTNLPMGARDVLNGVLQKHGLQVYMLARGDFYAYCHTHACPSLVDSLDAALEAECPGCVGEREIELRRRSLEQSVALARMQFRLRVGSV